MYLIIGRLPNAIRQNIGIKLHSVRQNIGIGSDDARILGVDKCFIFTLTSARLTLGRLQVLKSKKGKKILLLYWTIYLNYKKRLHNLLLLPL